LHAHGYEAVLGEDDYCELPRSIPNPCTKLTLSVLYDSFLFQPEFFSCPLAFFRVPYLEQPIIGLAGIKVN
jgi:hypothetical protein